MKKSNVKSGFTLIELVTVTALVGFLVVAISVMISNGLKSYRVGMKRIDYNEECSKAMLDFEKITRGATSIIEANDDSLTFLAYLKGDDHPAPSRISYYLDGTKFMRSLIAPVIVNEVITYPEENKQYTVVAENVVAQSFFSYFNDNSDELTFPIQIDVIKMVKMAISVDGDILNPPERAENATTVQLRNLKTNL